MTRRQAHNRFRLWTNEPWREFKGALVRALDRDYELVDRTDAAATSLDFLRTKRTWRCPHLRFTSEVIGDKTSLTVDYEYPLWRARLARPALVAMVLLIGSCGYWDRVTGSDTPWPTLACLCLMLTAILVFPGGFLLSQRDSMHLRQTVTRTLRESPYSAHYEETVRFRPFGLDVIVVALVSFVAGMATLACAYEGVARFTAFIAGVIGSVVILRFRRLRHQLAPQSPWTALLTMHQFASSFLTLSWGLVCFAGTIVPAVLMRDAVERIRSRWEEMDKWSSDQGLPAYLPDLSGVEAAVTRSMSSTVTGLGLAMLVFLLYVLLLFVLLARGWRSMAGDTKLRTQFEGHLGTRPGYTVLFITFYVIGALGIWIGITYSLVVGCEIVSHRQLLPSNLSLGATLQPVDSRELWIIEQIPSVLKYVPLLGIAVTCMYVARSTMITGRSLRRSRRERETLWARSEPLALRGPQDLVAQMKRHGVELRAGKLSSAGACSLPIGSNKYAAIVERSMVDRLDAAELEALVAHEVAHCALHHRRLRRYRRLSALAFLRSETLLSSFNLPVMEEEADAEAWRMLGGDATASDALIAMLRRLNTSPIAFTHDHAVGLLGARATTANYKCSRRTILGDVLLGVALLSRANTYLYIHPSHDRRIERLRELGHHGVAR